MAGRMPTTFLGSISGSNGSYTLSPSGKNSDKNGKKGKNGKSGRKRGLSLTSKGEKFKRRMWQKDTLELIDDTKASKFAEKWAEEKIQRRILFGDGYDQDKLASETETANRGRSKDSSYWGIRIKWFPALCRYGVSKDMMDVFNIIYLNSIQRNMSTRVTSHPIETGEHRSDMKVYEPTVISASGFLKLADLKNQENAEDADGYVYSTGYSLKRIRQILDLACCSGTDHGVVDGGGKAGIEVYLISPMDGVDNYRMTLESYSISADQDKADVFPLSLTMKEVMLTTTQSETKTSSPEHSSTASR